MDLDSIVQNFSKMKPKRFTTDSKYEEILFALCTKIHFSLLRPLLKELKDNNLQDKGVLKFYVQLVHLEDLKSDFEIGVRKQEDVLEHEQSLGEL